MRPRLERAPLSALTWCRLYVRTYTISICKTIRYALKVYVRNGTTRDISHYVLIHEEPGLSSNLFYIFISPHCPFTGE